MTQNQRLKKMKQRIENFEPKESICPICNRDFRRGCEHSIDEAKQRLQQLYDNELAKQQKGLVT